MPNDNGTSVRNVMPETTVILVTDILHFISIWHMVYHIMQANRTLSGKTVAMVT
jgi:hypothetical protein